MIRSARGGEVREVAGQTAPPPTYVAQGLITTRGQPIPDPRDPTGGGMGYGGGEVANGLKQPSRGRRRPRAWP